LRYGEGIDPVVLAVAADEFHKSDLPREIEGNYKPIVSSCYLESHALAVEYFGLWSSPSDLVSRVPVRGFCQSVL